MAISIITTLSHYQENMGIVHDNFVPLQGAKLNPSAIVDQKPWLSIQLAGISAYGRNNFGYLSNSTYINRADEFSYNYDRNNYNAYIDAEIDGPGASLVLSKFSVGLHTSVRLLISTKNVPGEIINNIAGDNFTDFEDETYNTNFSRMKGMSW